MVLVQMISLLMGLKSRHPLKSPCLTEFTVLNGDEEATTAIMLSAILAYCSTLASSWPTKAERRLVGNAVNSLDFMILSSAFKPIPANRLLTSLTNCDGRLSPYSIALSVLSINS